MENNLDQNLSEPKPSDLISLVMGDAAAKGAESQPPAPAVEKIGNIPVTEFMPAFEQATGFKSIEEVKAIREQAAQLDEWKRKASELEAKAAAPKFANQFVEKLNALVESGADHSKVAAYWKLANADVDKMEPVDLLVFQAQIQNPDVAPAHLRAFVLGQLGLDGEDVDFNSLPGAKLAELQIKASQAKEFISKERVSFETKAVQQPNIDAQNQMRQVQGQASATFWGEVLTQLPAVISFNDGDKEKGIPDYSFSFNPRPEVVQTARQEILKYVSENPDAYPKTKEGAEMMKNHFTAIVSAQSREDMLRAIFRDVYNGMKQEMVKKTSGPIPSGTDSPPKPNQSNALPDLMSLIKAGGKT